MITIQVAEGVTAVLTERTARLLDMANRASQRLHEGTLCESLDWEDYEDLMEEAFEAWDRLS